MSLVLDGSACPPVRGGQADRRRYGGSAAPGAGVGLLSGQIVLPGHTDRHTDLVQHPVDPIHRRIPLRTMMLIRRPVRTLPLDPRSEEHTSELQSRENLVCRLLLEKKKKHTTTYITY